LHAGHGEESGLAGEIELQTRREQRHEALTRCGERHGEGPVEVGHDREDVSDHEKGSRWAIELA
jgi:hypothetical protein